VPYATGQKYSDAAKIGTYLAQTQSTVRVKIVTDGKTRLHVPIPLDFESRKATSRSFDTEIQDVPGERAQRVQLFSQNAVRHDRQPESGVRQHSFESIY
jgi:hypothetical protein